MKTVARFIKEAGKSKETTLELSGSLNDIKKLETGDILNFVVAGGDIVLTGPDGKKVGVLEDTELRFKIRWALKKDGVVSAVIVDRDKKTVRIIIKSDISIFTEEEEEKLGEEKLKDENAEAAEDEESENEEKDESEVTPEIEEKP